MFASMVRYSGGHLNTCSSSYNQTNSDKIICMIRVKSLNLMGIYGHFEEMG